MMCKNCGNEIPENAKFCPKCGSPTEQKDDDKTVVNSNITENSAPADTSFQGGFAPQNNLNNNYNQPFQNPQFQSSSNIPNVPQNSYYPSYNPAPSYNPNPYYGYQYPYKKKKRKGWVVALVVVLAFAAVATVIGLIIHSAVKEIDNQSSSKITAANFEKVPLGSSTEQSLQILGKCTSSSTDSKNMKTYEFNSSNFNSTSISLTYGTNNKLKFKSYKTNNYTYIKFDMNNLSEGMGYVDVMSLLGKAKYCYAEVYYNNDDIVQTYDYKIYNYSSSNNSLKDLVVTFTDGSLVYYKES